MDIRKIESVCAVATHRSYSEAAFRTSVSPSVISKHVAAVEDELGIQIFHRATRSASVELTPDGEKVIGYLYELLHQYRLAREAADDARGAQQTLLRVGYVQQLGSYRENSILAGYNIEHPEVIIQRRALSVQDLPAELMSDAVDAVFLPLPDSTDIPHSDFARLWDGNYVVTEIMRMDRLSIGVPPQNSLWHCDQITEAEFSRLAGETFLFPVSEVTAPLLAPLVAKALHLGGQMRIRYADFSEKIMPCNIAATDGCLLPQLCLVPPTAIGNIRFIPVAGSCPGITLYLIYKKSADRGALRRLGNYVLSSSAQFYEEFSFVTTPKR